MVKFLDFSTISEFNQARSQINAGFISPASLLIPHGISPVFAQYLSHEDHTTKLQDLEIKNNLLYYKNILVCFNLVSYQGLNYPRIHLCNCQKVQELQQNGLNRAINISKQIHQTRLLRNVQPRYPQNQLEKLNLEICKYCLVQLDWQNYQHSLDQIQKQSILAHFQLSQFYRKYEHPQVNAIFSTLHSSPKQFNDYQHMITTLKLEQAKFKTRQQHLLQTQSESNLLSQQLRTTALQSESMQRLKHISQFILPQLGEIRQTLESRLKSSALMRDLNAYQFLASDLKSQYSHSFSALVLFLKDPLTDGTNTLIYLSHFTHPHPTLSLFFNKIFNDAIIKKTLAPARLQQNQSAALELNVNNIIEYGEVES